TGGCPGPEGRTLFSTSSTHPIPRWSIRTTCHFLSRRSFSNADLKRLVAYRCGKLGRLLSRLNTAFLSFPETRFQAMEGGGVFGESTPSGVSRQSTVRSGPASANDSARNRL